MIPDAQSVLDDMLRAAAEFDRGDERSGQRLSATGHCLRQQFYDIAFGSAPIPPENLLEIEDGNLHEADVKRWLRAAGYEITGERQEDGRNEGDEVVLLGGVARGHIDGAMLGGLVEVKSMSFLRFITFIEQGLADGHPEYFQQVQGYMGARGDPYTVVVAKAKDSGAVRGEMASRLRFRRKPVLIHPDVAVSPQRKLAVQVVPFDPDAFGVVTDRQERLADALESGVPPEREYEPKDWHCRWCGHFRRCYGE